MTTTVTFYSATEGWELCWPSNALLRNRVFNAMLNGPFQEASTKRICIPNFRKEHFELFLKHMDNTLQGQPIYISDGQVTMNGSGPQDLLAKFTQLIKDPRIDTIICLTELYRITHQYEEESLTSKYLQDIQDRALLVSDPTGIYKLLRFGLDFNVDIKTKSKQHSVEICVAIMQHHDTQMMQFFPSCLTRSTIGLIIIFWAATESNFAEGVKFVLSKRKLPLHDEDLARAAKANIELSVAKEIFKINPLFIKHLLRIKKIQLSAQLLAAYRHWEQVWLYCFEEGCVEVLAFMPKKCFTFNMQQKTFATIAVEKGLLHCLEIILKAGCDANIGDPLSKAIARQDKQMCKLLTDHGAKIDLTQVNTAINAVHESYKKNEVAKDVLLFIETTAVSNSLRSELYKYYQEHIN